MKKNLVFLFILFFIFISPCLAKMKLYISKNCQNCDLVSEGVKGKIEQLKYKDQLQVIDVTNIKTDLPPLPALIVDDEKVIIGTCLLEYLENRIENEESYSPHPLSQ